MYKIKKDIIDAVHEMNCNVPLQCIEACQKKKPSNISHKPYYINEDETHLEDTDPYWSNFLKAQETSTANYIYNMNLYGSGNDPTYVKHEPFPNELINQRLRNMPVIGALQRIDIFYMLSFILNLIQLPLNEQMNLLKYFQQIKLLDIETLQYLQIISRHPNNGLTNEQRFNLENEFTELINSVTRTIKINYFQPYDIFKKSMFEVDPYEIAYLKNIMETNNDLNKEQFMYLTNFIEYLQEIETELCSNYLNVLYEKGILPSNQLSSLIIYMQSKSKHFNTNRVQLLFQYLQNKMGFTICGNAVLPMANVEKNQLNNIDIEKIQKTINTLMNGKKNDIRLYELKSFIKILLTLQTEELINWLNYIKNSFTLTVQQLNFIQEFIKADRMNGNVAKLKNLQNILEIICTTPIGYKMTTKTYKPKVTDFETYMKGLKYIAQSKKSPVENEKK